MISKIKNGKLVLPDKVLMGKNLYYEDGIITAITEDDLPFDAYIDAEGNYVSPGFIDTHVHGGAGYFFTDRGIEPKLRILNVHLEHGTTSILPTPTACPRDVTLEFLEEISTMIDENLSDSRILGVHLEGSYFSQKQLGGQHSEYVRDPDPDEYNHIIKRYGNIIKRWSFAPELDGGIEFCKALIDAGITPSIGHSDATYDDVKKVYDLGLRMVTHLYSSMSTITRESGFRRLGVIESAYLLDDMVAEIITDGCHLPPELLKLILKGFGTDNLCMITDAILSACTNEKEYISGDKGEVRIIEDGVAKVADRSCFAGSIASTDRLVRTMVQKVGCTVYDAVKMITLNPAKTLKMDNIGILKEGCLADIVIFDDDINIKNVIVNGKVVK